ncbi:hypothetical protein Nepgr_002530 [Nepenthes gracilis]|uniref:Protein kinase domain-containing protein n=1 Tax=Nepenthes gracilis TaxID=150966 RepID=A0AAD3P6Z7_NEPGR|nr:hypothetical protein Nepgr_002530 [Nepenthes gracilis]
MGCLCSKGSSLEEYVDDNHSQKELSRSSVQLVAPPKKEIILGVIVDGSNHLASKVTSNANSGSLNRHIASQPHSGPLTGPSRQPAKTVSQVNSASLAKPLDEGDPKTIVVERPVTSYHQRRATVDFGINEGQKPMSRIISIQRGVQGEQIIAGWPSWLSSVAGEAIQGWVPRRADSFEKLDKIGQGTYSTVYKALDLETGKMVAMKKVRFVNMDPDSVRFMAREIFILRKLDHPNVIKLEGLVASRMSGSLYLIFEYMEHDLTGLSATPSIKFTEAQIKCYAKQLLSGLEHCHSRGVLHRDIKGSNLLINNDGVLKIGDFGLATSFTPDQKQPLTSRVVTLWYRAPELLLGSTDYGVAIDMWSAGCIIAEMFAGKPIMPGRTEVEQMHKIFKLCGSPAEDYWKQSKSSHATSFKPQQPYKRCVLETFKDFPPPALALVDSLLAIEPEKRGTASAALKSEFFTTKPLPCDPSTLPKYPPSKEYDVRLRDEEARRQRAEAVKGRGPESVRRGSRESNPLPTSQFDVDGDVSLQGQANLKGNGVNYSHHGSTATAFTVEARNQTVGNGLSHCSSMVHPSTAGSSWTKKAKEDDKKAKEDDAHMTSGQTNGPSRNAAELRIQIRGDGWVSRKESSTGYVPKKNRIHYSGPLMAPGGNLEEMLKDHERQIQQAVRNSKAKIKNNGDHRHSHSLQNPGRNIWEFRSEEIPVGCDGGDKILPWLDTQAHFISVLSFSLSTTTPPLKPPPYPPSFRTHAADVTHPPFGSSSPPLPHHSLSYFLSRKAAPELSLPPQPPHTLPTPIASVHPPVHHPPSFLSRSSFAILFQNHHRRRTLRRRRREPHEGSYPTSPLILILPRLVLAIGLNVVDEPKSCLSKGKEGLLHECGCRLGGWGGGRKGGGSAVRGKQRYVEEGIIYEEWRELLTRFHIYHN